MKNIEKIEFEEAMKTFIPEYVEAVSNKHSSSEIIGTIYKTSELPKWVQGHKLEEYWKAYMFHYKPSTKEAYDAQFVVKEPEFVLPELWCIEVNEQSKPYIKKYRESINYKPYEIGNWKYQTETCGDQNGNDNLKLTLSQFKKYVLKEEIVVEKVIEPLPQFKVIETIETITKVENNEGNQFFIGDIVKSLSNVIYNITKFEYNEDKTQIIAILNETSKFNINQIEHYIEPKVVEPEFILPEKWCITSTLESQNTIFDWLLENTNWKKLGDLSIGNHYCIEGNKCQGWMKFAPDRKIGYTEITFDQFKKYVLKAEVKETLLEKAKIIEHSHDFKIGDKIKIKLDNREFNFVYKIIKIEGNVLFFGNSIHSRVLAKNVIKVN